MLRRPNLIGLFRRPRAKLKRKPKSRTLAIEVLEDRVLLAAFASLADMESDKNFFGGESWLKDGVATTVYPEAADSVTFENAGSYNINFDRTPALGDHFIVSQTDVRDSAKPTFNLHAAQYEVGELNIFGTDPSLTVTNGEFISTGATRLGMNPDTEGSLILQVMGTVFEVNSGDEADDIYVGKGQLAVQTGTALNTNGSDIRVGITGIADFIVTGGIVSTVGDDATGDIIVGTGNRGYAVFGGSATQVTSGIGIIGEDDWGLVEVHDGATWKQTIKLLVGTADPAKANADPYGFLRVSTGGIVDSKNGAMVELGDVFITGESSTWDVKKGLVIRDAAFVDVSQQGHLNVKSGTHQGYLFVGSDPPPPFPGDPFPAPPGPSAPGDPVLSIIAGGIVTVENDGSSTKVGNVVISERGTVLVAGASSTLRTEAILLKQETSNLTVTNYGLVKTVKRGEKIEVEAGTVIVDSAGEIQADGALEVTETGTMIISGSAAAAGKVTSHSGLVNGADARVEVRGAGSQWALSFGEVRFELKEGTVELRDGGRLYDQFVNSEIAAPGKVLTLTGDSKLVWKIVTTKGDGAHIVPDGETNQIATLTFETDELDATAGMTYFADIEKVGGVSSNDVLDVTGVAKLDGVLNVTALSNSLDFVAGDSFTVLTTGATIIGEFDSVNLPSLSQGLAWQVEYTDDVTLRVVANNSAPIANDDSYNTQTGQTLTIDGSEGLLANDTDPDDLPAGPQTVLTVSSHSDPQYGSVTVDNSGGLVYTPPAGFSGTDSFTYVATDGELLSNVATVTIEVLAMSPPAISISDSSAYESDGSISFDVTLSEASTNVVKVDYVTSDGTAEAFTDYSSTYGTVEIQPGQSSATITINIHDDALDESAENFTITLSNPINAVIYDSGGTGTIDDDDEAPVASDDGTFYTGYESTLQENVLGNDYDMDAAPEPLTAQLVSSTAHGSLTLNSDGSFEYTPDVGYTGSDSFTYQASDGVNLSNTATVSIYVNSPPSIYIFDAQANEDGGFVTFDVWLSESSTGVVQVDYATSDGAAVAGSDYTTASGTIQFQPGETSATVSVPITNDSLDEAGSETFFVTLSNPLRAVISQPSATGTIYDDDLPPTVSLAGATVGESAGTAVFNVSLSGASGQDVTVYYYTYEDWSGHTATSDQDFTAVDYYGSLVIAAGETAATIEIEIQDDSVDEYDETFQVVIAWAENADVGEDYLAIGTIVDDDVARK